MNKVGTVALEGKLGEATGVEAAATRGEVEKSRVKVEATRKNVEAEAAPQAETEKSVAAVVPSKHNLAVLSSCFLNECQ